MMDCDGVRAMDCSDAICRLSLSAAVVAMFVLLYIAAVVSRLIIVPLARLLVSVS